MTGAAHTQPASELLTYDDLRAEPDDGRRRELIDGQLLVTPAPIPLHQIAVARLLALLLDTAPVQLEVLPAPVDWKLTEHTVLEPDVLVTTAEDTQGKFLAVTPLLVVEVLSPSSRRIDLILKRAVYEQAGVGSYWVIDPGVPSLDVFRLEGDGYLHIGRWEGEQACTDTVPFEVKVIPARLVGRRS